MSVGNRFSYLGNSSEATQDYPTETPSKNNPENRFISHLQSTYNQPNTLDPFYADRHASINQVEDAILNPQSYSGVEEPESQIPDEGLFLLDYGYDSLFNASYEGRQHLNSPFAFSIEQLQYNQQLRDEVAKIIEENLIVGLNQNRFYSDIHPDAKHASSAALAAFILTNSLRDPESDILIKACYSNSQHKDEAIKILTPYIEHPMKVTSTWTKYAEMFMESANMASHKLKYERVGDDMLEDLIVLAGYFALHPSVMFGSSSAVPKNRKHQRNLVLAFRTMAKAKGYNISDVEKAYSEVYRIFGHKFDDPIKGEYSDWMTVSEPEEVRRLVDFVPCDTQLESAAFSVASWFLKGGSSKPISYRNVIVRSRAVAAFGTIGGEYLYSKRSQGTNLRKQHRNQAKKMDKANSRYSSNGLKTIFMEQEVLVLPNSMYIEDSGSFLVYGKSPNNGSLRKLLRDYGFYTPVTIHNFPEYPI